MVWRVLGPWQGGGQPTGLVARELGDVIGGGAHDIDDGVEKESLKANAGGIAEEGLDILHPRDNVGPTPDQVEANDVTGFEGSPVGCQCPSGS